MKRDIILLSASAFALLSACSDLGFGDTAMTDADPGMAGPVKVSELTTENPAAPAPGGHHTGGMTVATAPTPGGTLKTAPPSMVEGAAPARPKPTRPAGPPKGATLAAVDPTPETPPMTGTSTEPAAAAPQICTKTVMLPPITEMKRKQVLVSPPTVRTETVPATYKTVTERVMVAPATTRREVVPATYKTVTRPAPATEGDSATRTVTEQVMVAPEQKRMVEVPAKYETVTERVKVAESYTEWRDSTKVYAIGAEALGGKILANQVSSQGVKCLVEIPPEYDTVTKRVLVSEATTREEVVPAQYETVTRQVNADDTEATQSGTITAQVIDTPETVRMVPVPAKYETQTRRVVDQPAKTREVEVPAVYREEMVETVIEPARKAEVNIVCDATRTRDWVRKLQKALKAQGLYKGRIDGISGRGTRTGLAKLQNGLDEVILIETARKLGL